MAIQTSVEKNGIPRPHRNNRDHVTADCPEKTETQVTRPPANNDDVPGSKERDESQVYPAYDTEGSAGSDERLYREVDWDGEKDPMNPKNFSTFRKWSIVLTLGFGSLAATVGSSIYTTTYEQMDAEFGNSRLVATLGLSTYVFGLGISPMVLGPLSEFYGRRIIYLTSFSMFLIWLIPCAVAPNIQTMLIARFFDGLSGSAFLSVAGGTVGDMFNKEELTGPMMVYSATPFLGPGLGFLSGSFINSNVEWRWTWYVMIIWAGIELLLIVFFVPETYAPAVLRVKARKIRKETGEDLWKAKIEVTDKSVARTVLVSLYRPFLILFLDPMCFNLCLFSAILLGILHLFFGAFPLVFSEVYSFTLWQTGLAFLGIVVGMLLAVASDPLWHYLYIHQVNKYERTHGQRGSEPEYRLPSSVVGSWFCVVGLFWFGWTTFRSIHWIVPIIGTGFFGTGIVLTYVGIFSYLVEAFPMYAASALSANSFARSCFAAAFPLFTRQMYNALGRHWATTLLACLTLIMAPFPFIFYVYGKQLRARSRFTPK